MDRVAVGSTKASGELTSVYDQWMNSVANGTYLGDCLVHCDETVSLSAETLSYSLTSKLADASRPDIHVKSAPPPELWRKFEGLLESFSLSALPDRIGLPDADDSGGEFLEVSLDGATKRVDFPRDADVPEAGRLLSALRDLRGRLAADHRG